MMCEDKEKSSETEIRIRSGSVDHPRHAAYIEFFPPREGSRWLLARLEWDMTNEMVVKNS
jgi:hypothetical protein